MVLKEEIEEELVFIEKVKDFFGGSSSMRYFILTMGCQLNENDSEKVCGMLERMGFVKTEVFQEADLIVFNTCCVRENAEEKLFGKIGEVKRLKGQRDVILAIGGCMMQEKHVLEKIHESYPFVDIIFGTHTLHRFPRDLYEVLQTRRHVEDVWDIDGKVYEGLPIKRNDKLKASVTIMYGCNNFCSYCIVPYVRGRERSRTPEDILQEVQGLAKDGYKEVTLLGQNVNSYCGINKEGNVVRFSDLLRRVNTIEGIERIRFISPHPKDFSDDVIEAIAECEKVCKLVHLPLQSGSTQILKRMNRKYTKEQYLELVRKMRKRIPGVVFSTDIIVGFPEETEEDFKDTLSVVSQVCFEQIFMFLFSRRVGTPADTMEDQIPEEIKHKRFDELKALAEKQVYERNQTYLGTVQQVLVEGKSKNNDKMLTGRTDSNKVVILEGNDTLIHHMVKVKIVSEHMWFLKGEVI